MTEQMMNRAMKSSSRDSIITIHSWSYGNWQRAASEPIHLQNKVRKLDNVFS